MKNFEVYYKDNFIGNTALENGDAPMGVAFGLFKPNASYKFEELSDQSQLKVKFNGNHIPCEGAAIEDYSEELNEIIITLLGVPYPLYEEIFPEHVASYNKQFPSS